MSKIFYKEYGGGYPLIFLHGFCETNFVWQSIAEELKDDFRAIVFDLPGFGNSPLPGDSLTIDSVAVQIRNELKNLNIEKCIVFGHSLGGYVTSSLVRQFPELIDGYCLFNSTVFEDTPDKKENRNKLIELIQVNGTASFIQTFIPSLFYTQRVEEFRNEINQLRAIGKNISPESVIQYAAAMRDRKDETSTLVANNKKALIISGKEDKNVPQEVSKKMGELIDKKNFHLLDKTAHMSMFECKNEVSGILKDYVSRMLM